MARRGGIRIPITPDGVAAAARGDEGVGGVAGFLVLYGGVVALDIFRRGGLQSVDRHRFGAYFGGGFAFALLAWYQPGFAAVLVAGVLLIQLLNVAPAVADWFAATVITPLGSAAGVGSRLNTPQPTGVGGFGPR